MVGKAPKTAAAKKAMAKKKTEGQPKKKKSEYYIKSEDMIREIVESKKTGRITEELGRMFLVLAKRYATVPRFSGYSYNEDLQGFAILTLCKVWKSFDETKYSNPFAYYTQVIHNAFFQYDNAERRQRDIRDEMLIKQGFQPSFNYADRIGNEEHDPDGDRDFMEVYNDSAAVLRAEEMPDDDAFTPQTESVETAAMGGSVVPEEETEISVPIDDEEDNI